MERPRACEGVSEQLDRAQVRRYRGEDVYLACCSEGRCPERTRLGLHLARGVGLFPVTVSPKGPHRCGAALPCCAHALASDRLNRCI
jgi:hypothetical protein